MKFVKFLSPIPLVFLALSVFSQNDIVIGSMYKFNLQRQNNHGDAWILHNAYYDTGEDGLKYSSTHANGFGARGIRFGYGSAKGIYFYASGENTTADAAFTPTTRMFISNNGNVGIGTTTPAGRLAVYGTMYVGNENSTAQYRVSIGGSGGDYGSIGYGYRYTGTSDSYVHAISDKASQLMFYDGGFLFRTAPSNSATTGVNFTNRVKIWEGGTVGIGTETLDTNYKLIVNGKIKAEEQILVVQNVADYVFHDDYHLMPLEDVESYVKQHKHLPGVPSKGEIDVTGFPVGQMTNKILEKVEELTLHLIELKKSNDELAKENEELKQRLEVVEKQLKDGK